MSLRIRVGEREEKKKVGERVGGKEGEVERLRRNCAINFWQKQKMQVTHLYRDGFVWARQWWAVAPPLPSVGIAVGVAHCVCVCAPDALQTTTTL